jgi:hypothetical protein
MPRPKPEKRDGDDFSHAGCRRKSGPAQFSLEVAQLEIMNKRAVAPFPDWSPFFPACRLAALFGPRAMCAFNLLSW